MLKAAVNGQAGPPLRVGMQRTNGATVDDWFPIKESA